MENIIRNMENKVEYSRYYWYGITPNKNNKLNNLIEAWNTFAVLFQKDSGGFWTKANFIRTDVIETQKRILEYANKPEDEITIGILSYNQSIKPSKLYNKMYKNAMLPFYKLGRKQYEKTPLQVFDELKKLMHVNSLQDEYKKAVKEKGLIDMNIDYKGNW